MFLHCQGTALSRTYVQNVGISVSSLLNIKVTEQI